ncbi:MAG: hypothetical protein K8S98_00965 [Planctomycetes bacterium]|nr:hypothetical protein [Planctomycetota bacterium]
MAPPFPAWLEVFGRLHPLVLHLPIGLFVGLAVVELLGAFGVFELPRRVTGVWVGLAALSACATAASGWVLSHESGYGGETLERHETLGLIVGGLALVVSALHWMTRGGSRVGVVRVYRFVLFVAAAVLVPTGHFGATLTHGEDFLLEPLREKPAPPVEAAPVASTYATVIAPILASRCTACHGESKHKGKLALHTPEAIAKGGESGPPIDRARPSESEMLRRLKTPLDDDDHMPPGEKPQPTAEESAALEAWISAGAPFEGVVNGVATTSARTSAIETPTPPKPPKPIGPSDDALAALSTAFIHVETVERETHSLWIDFSAVATDTDDAAVERLVAPVGEFVAELTLARTKVGAGALALAAKLPRLRRLDLRAAPIDDAALAKLAGHAALAELVLAQTKLTDASVDTLLALPALTRVFLWRSGVGAEGLARLRAARPTLIVDAGDEPDSAPTNAETEIKLTSDAPLPGAAPIVASLVPINTKCPVSGSPINPKYSVVHDGKVIGFCCPNCPKEFWADPTKFLSKLE